MEQSKACVNKTTISYGVDFKNQNCLICMESLEHLIHEKEHAELVRLVPCLHAMCNECFFLFAKKLNTDKCPSCTQTIQHYQVTTRQLGNGQFTDNKSFSDLLDQSNDSTTRSSSSPDTFEEFYGLDHAFFREEVEKLLKLQKYVSQIRLKEHMRQKTHCELEVQTLHEIECQLHEMHEGILGLQRFDPNQWVVQVQQMTETLLKIKSGQFTKELSDIFIPEQNSSTFNAINDDESFCTDFCQFEIQQSAPKQRKGKNKKKGGRGGKYQTVLITSGQQTSFIGDQVAN